MTTIRMPRQQHCQYAIHGAAYVMRRGGSFWEPEDELQRSVRQNNTGVMLVDCSTEADARRVRQLLDAQGFVPGVDYGVFSLGKGGVPCPGIDASRDFDGCSVEAFGDGTWKLPPRPPEVAARLEAEFEATRAERFDFYSRVAQAVGVPRSVIDSATQRPNADERIRALLGGMGASIPPEKGE